MSCNHLADCMRCGDLVDALELEAVKLHARIKALEAAVETAACRFEDPKFHCSWQDAADDLRRVGVR